MSKAYERVLECSSDYAFVLEDDVILECPDAAAALIEEFDQRRRDAGTAFWLAPRIIDELTGDELRGGVHVFFVPLLRRIGFPDRPHVSWGQRLIAEANGLTWLQSDRVVGRHMMGTPLDVYERYVWLQMRSAARERRAPELDKLLARATAMDRDVDWMSCLGVLDGRVLAPRSTSKGGSVSGPGFAGLTISALSKEEVRRRVREILESGTEVPAAQEA